MAMKTAPLLTATIAHDASPGWRLLFRPVHGRCFRQKDVERANEKK
jgi:hypothetical protein